MLSIIIPCYNEEKNIAKAAQTLKTVLDEAGIAFELLFINDGSQDNSCQEIVNLYGNYPISLYSFSRNFGKEAAIFCGLKHVKGECAIIYDCDMQFPASTIVEMYRKWQEGYLLVEGIKKERQKESLAKRWGLSYSILYLIEGETLIYKMRLISS